jgi:hypothetical protein
VTTATGQSVGIDVSEQHLDVHIHPEGLEGRMRLPASGALVRDDLGAIAPPPLRDLIQGGS